MIQMPSSLDVQVHLVSFSLAGTCIPLGQMTLREALAIMKRWKDAQNAATVGDSEQAKDARQWLETGVWEFTNRIAGQEVTRACIQVSLVKGFLWQEVGIDPNERLAQVAENVQKQQKTGDEWKQGEDES